MAIPITIPRLGWNMDEGVFAGWLKRDGEQVTAGERIFSLESEKATEEIECLDSGILRMAPNCPKTGDTVAVGVVIAFLLGPGEPLPDWNVPTAAKREASSTTTKAEANGGAIADAPAVRSKPPEIATPSISPRALRAATRLGVDWTALRGSGRTGRIRERDILAVTPTRSGDSASGITRMRKTIADRMLASHRDTASVTLTTTADATELVRLRLRWKAENQPAPSINDIFIKLSALALGKHPVLNSRWSGERIVASSSIHIGFAVDTDVGLIVPVVRDAASASLKQISATTRDLIERAQQRRLSVDEMQGGTFTITNLGGFGIDAFTPIINAPECAILGLGRIQKQPVVRGDAIVIRDMISLSLTFDHRIVDGAPAARFLQTLTQLIEKPEVLL